MRSVVLKKLKVLELFSGTESVSKQFRARGHETFTIDNNPVFAGLTSWQTDILEVTAEDILERFGKPDVMWCSVPCESFSVAAIGRNWEKIGEELYPKSKKAEIGISLLKKTLSLINELKPKYWFIENPRGAMRRMPQLQKFNRYTTTYCQWGDFRMKPTDLWTNHPNPRFKPPCKNGDPCHVSAPRGSRTGTQGIKSTIDRARIPDELCKHIVNICEEGFETE